VDGLAGESVIESIKPLPPDPATGLAQGRVTVRCEHCDEPPAPWADLLLAPPRPRAMKRLLPQIAQMGVGRIVLVGARKVEKAFWGAQLLKEGVHRPLLLDGLMQAGTTAMPVIQVERDFRRYVEGGRFEADFSAASRRVVAHPYAQGEERPGLSSACGAAGSGRVLVAVGPEGGWTDDEVALLELHGFGRLSLGPRILRTDTAVVALLARLMPCQG
jgi:RsmE family RNA methyltransferase